MSNINNHGVSMNKIELSPHLQELSCENAAAIQGGASAQLFTDPNFSGTATNIFDYDVPLVPFNDQTSSIKVYSGQWTFWSDANYSGSGLILGPGEYSDLKNLNGGVYNDVISSAKINVQ
ncbi:beta/gamma crystallin-related protein [Nostoc sp.]|uniref:beta/gamma crystallin-related protein n=1 Tax=Nostoc sp. TaxID=1180 RepID=UPI002FF8E363